MGSPRFRAPLNLELDFGSGSAPTLNLGPDLGLVWEGSGLNLGSALNCGNTTIKVPRVLFIIGDRPEGESKEESLKGVPSTRLKLVKVRVVSEAASYILVKDVAVCCCAASKGVIREDIFFFRVQLLVNGMEKKEIKAMVFINVLLCFTYRTSSYLTVYNK
jgi:hypothetical protein